MKNKKRQHTVWVFECKFHDGHKIRAGYVFNPPAPRDCIRVEIPAGDSGVGFYMRLDEANAVLTGLAAAMGYGFNRQEYKRQKRIGYFHNDNKTNT